MALLIMTDWSTAHCHNSNELNPPLACRGSLNEDLNKGVCTGTYNGDDRTMTWSDLMMVVNLTRATQMQELGGSRSANACMLVSPAGL